MSWHLNEGPGIVKPGGNEMGLAFGAFLKWWLIIAAIAVGGVLLFVFGGALLDLIPRFVWFVLGAICFFWALQNAIAVGVQRGIEGSR